LRKPEIELNFELELHLLKSWSKFMPAPNHAQMQIHYDKQKNGEDSYAKIGDDYCDFSVWVDRQCDVIIITVKAT